MFPLRLLFYMVGCVAMVVAWVDEEVNHVLVTYKVNKVPISNYPAQFKSA